MVSTTSVERPAYMSWTPQRPNPYVPNLWVGVRKKVSPDRKLQGRAVGQGHSSRGVPKATLMWREFPRKGTELFDMIKIPFFLFCFVEPEVTKEKAKPVPEKKGLTYCVD